MRVGSCESWSAAPPFAARHPHLDIVAFEACEHTYRDLAIELGAASAQALVNRARVQAGTERVSFITDDIIVQRFVEIDGVLRTVMAIHKMRGSEHSHDFLTYEITSQGAVIGGPLRHYRGILTGVPELQPQLLESGHDGLTDRESTVLSTLVRLGEVTREILAEHMGVPTPEPDETIARLELLGYLSMATEKGVENLRAIAQGDWKKKTIP